MLEEPDSLYFTYRIKLNTYYHIVNSTTTHITRMNILFDVIDYSIL